jgi:3-hexulose-6-phosphate synthase/6-phospho-3-hexuloisomerase
VGFVQISLDCPGCEEAVKLAKLAMQAGVHWLEAGTGLLLGSGLEGIRVLRREFPDMPIIADTKIMDGGYPLSKWCGNAGADYTVVMSAAGEHVIGGALRWRDEFGTKVMVDTMYEKDQVAACKRCEDLGVDYLVLHLGFEERAVETTRSALDYLEPVRNAVSLPVQVVGGLSIADSVRAFEMGAHSVAIGSPIVPGDAGSRMVDDLRRIVEAADRSPHGKNRP